jgi:hypothetical protein
LTTASVGSIAVQDLGKELPVTAIAPDGEHIHQLDSDTCQAWHAYSARLRDLSGEEYERAERESWAKLQSDLRRVERRRRSLTQNTT